MPQFAHDTLELINEAVSGRLPLPEACLELGITERTYYRWRRKQKSGDPGDSRQNSVRDAPANRLTTEEAEIMAVLHSPEFADLPPTQIVHRCSVHSRDVSCMLQDGG